VVGDGSREDEAEEEGGPEVSSCSRRVLRRMWERSLTARWSTVSHSRQKKEKEQEGQNIAAGCSSQWAHILKRRRRERERGREGGRGMRTSTYPPPLSFSPPPSAIPFLPSPFKHIPRLTLPLRRRVSSSLDLSLLPPLPLYVLHQHHRGRSGGHRSFQALNTISMRPVDGQQLPRIQGVKTVFREMTRDW